MQSLLLLVHGSSLEEMKSNLDAAWKEFSSQYPSSGKQSNYIATKPEATTKNSFEFEMTDKGYLADVMVQDYYANQNNDADS